jgi:uncharacterized protein
VKLMPGLEFTLLLLFTGATGYFALRRVQDFKPFMASQASADRVRFMGHWRRRSAILHLGGGGLALALIGHLSALVVMPAEFQDLSQRARALVAEGHPFPHLGALSVGVLTGVMVNLVALAKYPKLMSRLSGPAAALIPRNAAEIRLVWMMSINAGVGEELVFRLLLPLLLMAITHQPLLAFVIATAIFGLAHIYQGWVPVFVTGALGAAFSVTYLLTGNLWLVMGLHALMNLTSLVFRPVIVSFLQRKLAIR